jgi:hypothetical protein
MVQNILVLGNESVVKVFFVLDVEKMVMTDVFVSVFGITEGGLDGWKTNVFAIYQVSDLSSIDLFGIPRVSVFKFVLVV